MKTHTKTARDLSGSIHRKIRQRVGSQWVVLFADLKEYARKHGCPEWRLRKIIEEEIVLRPRYDKEGLLWDNKKRKAHPPGTLHIKGGVLTKWATPKVPQKAKNTYWDEQKNHPGYPDILKIKTGYEPDDYRSYYINRKGRRVRAFVPPRPVYLSVKYYLEKYKGIWYEIRGQYRNSPRWMSFPRLRRQLNRKELKRFNLTNTRPKT